MLTETMLTHVPDQLFEGYSAEVPASRPGAGGQDQLLVLRFSHTYMMLDYTCDSSPQACVSTQPVVHSRWCWGSATFPQQPPPQLQQLLTTGRVKAHAEVELLSV